MNVSTNSVSTKRTRLVLFTLSSFWSIITTSVPNSGWNCSRGSEIAGAWLSRLSCTTTQRIQLETEFVDEHVREDDESSRQRLCLGFARLTRKSIEPILASFDHTSRRSTSAESSNLRQESQTRQTLRPFQHIVITISTIPMSDVGETVSRERQLAFSFGHFGPFAS